jgi:hypothetical protein
MTIYANEVENSLTIPYLCLLKASGFDSGNRRSIYTCMYVCMYVCKCGLEQCALCTAQLTFQADVQVIGFELLVVVFAFIFDRVAEDAVLFIIVTTWFGWKRGRRAVVR